MATPVVNYNVSTWLAQRAMDAALIGPPKPPQRVALPGAKEAIDHDRLLAHQELGRDAHEIVERVNRRWEERNAERLAAHRAWASGPYVRAIEETRRAELEREAENRRRQARFEELTAPVED